MDLTSILVLLGSVGVLACSADLFVHASSKIGETLRLPKLFVGILLVGFATTAPELAVSVQSSLLGHPEIALGNALGSVMADDGLALALVAILSAAPVVIEPRILKSAGLFLIAIDLLAYGLAWNGYVSRVEGVLLIVILVGYYVWVLTSESRRRRSNDRANGNGEPFCKHPLGKCFFQFGLGLAGVILAARGIIWGAENLARSLGVTEAIIGLTVVAFGTSLPEIATCVAAARRGEGQIAVGNILGADILNVLWIIGMSAAVTPITVPVKIINFAFPWMLGIVLTMLICMRIGYRIGRVKGIILFALYVAYIATAVRWFY
jgi:cation:H+ antiporter